MRFLSQDGRETERILAKVSAAHVVGLHGHRGILTVHIMHSLRVLVTRPEKATATPHMNVGAVLDQIEQHFEVAIGDAHVQRCLTVHFIVQINVVYYFWIECEYSLGQQIVVPRIIQETHVKQTFAVGAALVHFKK